MADRLAPRRGMQLLRDEAADYETSLTTAKELETEDEPAAKDEKKRKEDLVKDAMDRFKLIVEIEGDQRDREVEDLKFDRALPEDQWPEGIRKARAGGIAPDGSVIHARPCLVIPKLDQPVQQVINEARKARLGIIIKPNGNGANKEGAKLRQGMIRAIEQDSAPGGRGRGRPPEQAGPVFSVDPASRALHMRSTHRTHSIAWKADRETLAAVDALKTLLASDSPWIFHGRLESGMGLLCNNVLHDRSAFTENSSQRRLLYRARYYDRIAGT